MRRTSRSLCQGVEGNWQRLREKVVGGQRAGQILPPQMKAWSNKVGRRFHRKVMYILMKKPIPIR